MCAYALFLLSLQGFEQWQCLQMQAVQRFAVADLSNWYLDVIKDRLYVSAADSFDRRAAQTVLHSLVQARVLPQLLACSFVHLILRWHCLFCFAFLACQARRSLVAQGALVGPIDRMCTATWCTACTPGGMRMVIHEKARRVS